MKLPFSSAGSRVRRNLAFGLGILLAGFLALVIEYRAGNGGTILLEVPLTVADFAGTYETTPVEASADLIFKTRVSAPVDNSWMSVRASALDSAGRIVDECDLKLEYYHGIHEGKPYRGGSQFAGGFLRVFAPGSYRFRIQVTAGEGDSAVPQTTQAGKPLRFVILPGGGHASQWRLVGFMIAMAAGLAVFLSAMADLRRVNNNQRGTEKHGDPAAPGISGPEGGDRMILIDGLRGVACLSVVACHFFLPGVSQIAPVATEIFPVFIVEALHHGELGVEMFFVLSGVVIAYSIRNRVVSGSFLWRFAFRRSIRLDPPYLLSIGLTMGASAWHFPDTLYELGTWIEGGRGLLVNAFYLQNLLYYPQIVGIAWTLCLELQFYLAFVVLVWMAQSLGNWLRRHEMRHPLPSGPFAFTVVFGPLAVLSLMAWFSSLRDFSFMGTWFRFFLGALTCWAMLGRIGKAIPGGFILVLLGVGIFKNDPRSAAAALTALVILISHWRGSLSRWLSGQVWQFLGRISYSLYLMHFVVAVPVVNWLWSLSPHTPAVAVTFLGAGVALSIVAAWLCYRYIERPSIALSRTISY